MAPERPARTPGRRQLGIAQLLLAASAVALWVSSRMTWVFIRSADGLGQPRTVELPGSTWSTALLPLAALQVATALAVLAVRGWALRALAVLTALTGLALGYIGISQWVVPDVAARAADLVRIPIMNLVGSGRFHGGAVLALVAAAATVVAAALLLRAARLLGGASETRYAAPATRRAQIAQPSTAESGPALSARTIWDALNEGRDLTDIAEGDPRGDASQPGRDAGGEARGGE